MRRALERRLPAAEIPEIVAGLKQGVLWGAAVSVLVLPPSGVGHRMTLPAPPHAQVLASAPATPIVSNRRPPMAVRRADFGAVQPAPTARAIADWVADSRDNRGLSFAVLDKRGARLYVFDPQARLVGSSMVLLGSATGDDTLAGVGNKPLSALQPHERTTPAGRFVSEPGRDAEGDDVVWVDYDAAVAMHRVKVIDPKERRFERIATPSAADKRISNGCINVPIAFFDQVVKPALGRTHAVVYVLPDVKPLRQVFANAYDVNAAQRRADATL